MCWRFSAALLVASVFASIMTIRSVGQRREPPKRSPIRNQNTGSPIRRVDFLNFTYPTSSDCRKELGLDTVTVHNGEFKRRNNSDESFSVNESYFGVVERRSVRAQRVSIGRLSMAT